MELLPTIINSLAALLWPVIVIVLIFLFRPALGAIIESARSRRFTIKVGGQELTMEEANDQQHQLIADLQTQVVELRKRVEGTPAAAEASTRLQPTAADVESRPVLWVDDVPKNNSYFVEQLSKLKIDVDLALSTSDAMAKFEKRNYRYVISDMGRQEEGTFNPDAGLDLLRYVRGKDPKVPFVLFCHPNAVRDFGDEARRLGATGITSSPTELFGLLGLGQARR